MVRGVADDDVDDSSSARSKAIRRTDARPRSWRDAVHERQRACPLQHEFGHEALHAAQIELAFGHIAVFVKSGQLSLVTAADAEQPIPEQSLSSSATCASR